MSGHVRACAHTHTQIKLHTKGAKEDGALQLKRTQMREVKTHINEGRHCSHSTNPHNILPRKVT